MNVQRAELYFLSVLFEKNKKIKSKALFLKIRQSDFCQMYDNNIF